MKELHNEKIIEQEKENCGAEVTGGMRDRVRGKRERDWCLIFGVWYFKILSFFRMENGFGKFFDVEMAKNWKNLEKIL